MKFALAILPLLALASWAEDDNAALTIHRIETETADRIQFRILDPILGTGRASAFAKLAITVRHDQQRSMRAGEGRSTKNISRASVSVATETTVCAEYDRDLFRGFGLDQRTTTYVVVQEAPADKIPLQVTNAGEQTQHASQIKSTEEARQDFSTRYSAMSLVIIHDDRVPRRKLDQVRAALAAIYKPDAPAMTFLPLEFQAAD